MKKFFILTSCFLFVTVCSPKLCDAATKTVIAHSLASVASMLELTVSQEGNSEIKFGNIMPSAIDPTVTGPIKVQVDVKSNSGSRYQVTQNINGPLTNGQKGQIDPSQLKFISIAQKTAGTVVKTPTSVLPSSQVIFLSDAEGKNDTIGVEYTLIVPPAQEPGNYSALITYTVSTI